jgi:hypothetical protein
VRALASWGLLALFAAGFAGAVLRERWVRLASVMAMLAAAAGALATLIGPVAGLWAAGPLVATLVQGPGPARRPLAFDPLVRRASITALLAVGASLAALQFPIGDLPRPSAVVLWNLGALGLSWIVTGLDTGEFVAGGSLAIAGGSALLLAGSNQGWLTVAVAGVLAGVPALRLYPGRVPGLPPGLAAGVGLTVLLLLAGPPSRVSLADLTFDLLPPALLAVAVLLMGAWAVQPDGRGLAAVPATLMLLAASPALRWAALAASVTVLLEPEGRDTRLTWGGLALLASTTVLSGALDPAPRLRLTTVALVGGWLLLAGGRRVPALLASIATLFLVLQAASLPVAAVGRFQLLAAVTAVFLLAGMLIDPHDARRRLSLGLALVALATVTAIGTLAALLLVIDVLAMEATGGPGAGRRWRPVRLLARSGWPPTVAFSGRTLAVLAAIETSPLLGILGLGLLLALLLSPLLAQQPGAEPPPGRARGLVMAVISLATGLVPGWVARLGHL